LAGPPKMTAPRIVGQERSDEGGIGANRRASGGLGRSPEHSESIPPSPPAFAKPTAGRPSVSRPRPSQAWSLLAEPRAKAARHRLGEGGPDTQHRDPLYALRSSPARR
jgi:hypothetical protein